MSLTYSQFLRWALSHLGIVVSLFNFVEAILSAGTIEEKAGAIKAIIDTLLPAVKDFPTVAVASVETDEQLESSVLQAMAAEPHAAAIDFSKWDGKRLKAIWEVVGPLLPVLLSLLK